MTPPEHRRRRGSQRREPGCRGSFQLLSKWGPSVISSIWRSPITPCHGGNLRWYRRPILPPCRGVIALVEVDEVPEVSTTDRRPTARLGHDQLGHAKVSMTQDNYFGRKVAKTGAAAVLAPLGQLGSGREK